MFTLPCKGLLCICATIIGGRVSLPWYSDTTFFPLLSSPTIVFVFWHCYCNSNFCFQFKTKKRIVVSAVWSGLVCQRHQLPHQPTNPTFVLGQVRIIPTSAKLEMFPSLAEPEPHVKKNSGFCVSSNCTCNALFRHFPYTRDRTCSSMSPGDLA